jgi:hypothetical protein
LKQKYSDGCEDADRLGNDSFLVVDHGDVAFDLQNLKLLGWGLTFFFQYCLEIVQVLQLSVMI